MERSFVAFTPKSRGAKDLDREKSKEKELIK